MVRSAQLIDAHAEHQFIRLQHLFGVVFADLRGHRIPPKPVLDAEHPALRQGVQGSYVE
jgi:hypothetical protein